ncbi:MAG: phage tail protein [Solirubrobacterales bacterium]
MPAKETERRYRAIGPRQFARKSLPPRSAPSDPEVSRRAGTSEAVAPPTASARAYLRASVPAIYQDGDFGLRFLGALETLLDPIVAALDALPAHFDADLAPRDVLELVAAWLGVELDESWAQGRQGELVSSASELARGRGTRAGLVLALRLAFPGLPLEVEDRGGVTWGDEVGWAATDAQAGFVVRCPVPVPEEEQATIAVLVDESKPAHVSYELVMEAPPTDYEGGGSS